MKKDFTWHRFWRLVVVREWKKWKGYNRYLVCKCDCGNVKEIAYSSLSYWCSQSCGCYRKENTISRSTKHWMRWTRLYHIRENMKKRCDNLKTYAYRNYWWRWISYCEKRETFDWFYEDMKDWYEEHLTLDRIDNEWNYCKENCRWATRQQQSENKRNNIYITKNWIKKTFYWWCDYLWLSRSTVGNRVYWLWWTYEEALFWK